jgi:predicted phosphoadenosine phosphosulfate sulfurtransferase
MVMERQFKRVYQGRNVWDATQGRLKFIFDNFERVYVSFSGGKDSGVLLNLAIDYVRKNCPDRKIGVQIMDNEANYKLSTQFMMKILDENRDILDIYWCCLPITLPCTVSVYHSDWQCWGNDCHDRWIQDRPDRDYVVTWENRLEKGFDWFHADTHYDEFWDGFAEWYSQGKLTANLIGIRTQESLNRFRAIMNERKETLHGKMWTKKNTEHVFNCYPIFDWKTDDIWTANAKNEWEYNKLYDMFYKAGVPINSMRVASPFMSEAKTSLNMYRVIDPEIWTRLVARVNGANFVATYGKQLDYKSVKLPEGHTWKSFVKFLLDTLPKETGDNFKQRFAQGLRFWARVGRGLYPETIAELRAAGVRFYLNGKTPHGSQMLDRVRIVTPPDHVDFLSKNNSMVHSWKRFAITILKNDHTCKYLGLAPTKEQSARQRQIMSKYKCIEDVYKK